MKKVQTMVLAAVVLMAGLALTNLWGMNWAGGSVLVGVAAFFIIKALEKQPDAGSGLDARAVPTDLRRRSVWPWLLLPLVLDAVQLLIAKLWWPELLLHIRARSGQILAYDQVALLLVQLLVMALGEEIAWRAFFQRRLAQKLPIWLAIGVSSLLFALGHLAVGQPVVVAVDLLGVFLNSIAYSMVFKKTDNAWLSFIAHALANLLSVAGLLLVL